MTEQEFQAVYERQAEQVYKICCFYLGGRTDAQDAVQNIFIKLWEKNITFRDEQHEKAWFHVAARNHCRDILRNGWRKRRVDMEKLPERPADGKAPENPYLEEALARIPAKQKEVIYLYYYEEYSIREISRLLNRKESGL